MKRYLNNEYTLLAAVLILLAIGYTLLCSPYAGYIYDDGIYIQLGQTLANGLDYRLWSDPHDSVLIKYPPGYPIFLRA